MQARIFSGAKLLPASLSSDSGGAALMRGMKVSVLRAGQRPVELKANPHQFAGAHHIGITATTDVAISKSKPELELRAQRDCVSRISTIFAGTDARSD
jgi:hypothetical protein